MNGTASGIEHKPAARRERGFALLIIFLMAAAVALMIYQQLPRVAFESAREKEQLVMDRGNQYRRAIEVYYAVNKRYPAKLEDLENTNDKRYLRRRYVDPLTGKDEWRLIHSNGSALTDSLVEKPPGQNAQNGLPGGGPLGANNLNSGAGGNGGFSALGAGGAGNNLGNNAGAGTNLGNNAGNPNDPANPQPPPALNPAARARPSDRIVGQNGVPSTAQNAFPAGFGQPNGNTPQYDPNDPRTWPAITTLVPTAGQGQTGQTGQPANQFGQQQGQQVQLMTNGALSGQSAGQNPTGFNGTPPFPGGLPGQAGGQGGANPQQLGLTGGNFAGNPQVLSQAGFDTNQNTSNQNTSNQNAFNQSGSNQNAFNQNQAGQNFVGPPANSVPPPFSNGGPNPALALIGAQLTQGTPAPTAQNTGLGNQNTPNQGIAFGMPNGLGANGVNATGQPGTTGGPGIAGVASRFEGPSIKAYKERLKYQEWEFVYRPEDSNKGGVTVPGQQGLGPAGQGATGQNSMGTNSIGPGVGGNQNQNGNSLGLFQNTPNSNGTAAPAASNPPGQP